MTQGQHSVRILYDPNFNDEAVFHSSFRSNEQSTTFFTDGDFANGGQASWGIGVGVLYVFIDDLSSPVLSTPISLSDTLQLDDGRAFAGFTASTGENMWQVHDILDWQFRSLTLDKIYFEPTLVNGEGAFECMVGGSCIHFPDAAHYIRSI